MDERKTLIGHRLAGGARSPRHRKIPANPHPAPPYDPRKPAPRATPVDNYVINGCRTTAVKIWKRAIP